MRFMRTEVSFYFLRQERKRAKYIERALEARLTKLEKVEDISVLSFVTCELVDQPLAKAERLTECQINSNVRNVPELVLHTRSLESERVVLSVPCEDVSNKTMVKEDQIEQLMDSSLVKSLICLYRTGHGGQNVETLREAPHTLAGGCVSAVGFREPTQTQPSRTVYTIQCGHLGIAPNAVAANIEIRINEEIEAVHSKNLMIVVEDYDICVKSDSRISKNLVKFVKNAALEFCAGLGIAIESRMIGQYNFEMWYKL